MNVDQIINEAFTAAQQASLDFERKNGDQIWPCGFAWVNTPGTSVIARQLKKTGAGRKSYHRGIDIWNPSGHPTQNMDIKLAGAQAFAEVLVKHGFKAHADCRMD